MDGWVGQKALLCNVALEMPDVEKFKILKIIKVDKNRLTIALGLKHGDCWAA